MAFSISTRKEQKALLVPLLQRRDWAALFAWAQPAPHPLSVLVSLLNETDDLLRWRAIEALGLLAAARAAEDLEAVRDLVRRQFWSMNDESGNVAWHAPEAIGEILFRVPALAKDYLSMLVSFRGTYPFQAGVHWAMARLAETQRDLLQSEIPSLLDALADPEPRVRGFAALALESLNPGIARERLQRLLEDGAEVPLYDLTTGELQEISVGEMARHALIESS